MGGPTSRGHSKPRGGVRGRRGSVEGEVSRKEGARTPVGRGASREGGSSGGVPAGEGHRRPPSATSSAADKPAATRGGGGAGWAAPGEGPPAPPTGCRLCRPGCGSICKSNGPAPAQPFTAHTLAPAACGCRLGELLISSHVWGPACLLTAQGGLPALGDTLRGQNQQPHGVRHGGGERA